MSWNNALPFWVWELEYEEFIARLTGAIGDEWHPQFSRSIPKEIYETTKN